MSDQESISEEITHVIKTVVTFSKMVKDAELFCKTNGDVQQAMKCARRLENTYKELRDKQLHFLFIRRMCETLQVEEDSFDISIMQCACDTLLEAVLTSNSVPSSCVLCCMNNYIEVCGKERFTQLMSAVIVKSEACRVLLDFIGLIENDSQTGIIFQANALCRLLTAKDNKAAVISVVHDWLNSEEERRIHVVFQAISLAGLANSISKTLVEGLVSVLDDRQEAAVLYWPTVLSSPVSIYVLKESKSLFYASLDFLTKCAENFEQTPHLTWRSCENGPCQVITFDMIVKYIQFLKSADKSLASLVDTFISERCTLPGCTFWEDIIVSLPT